MKLRVTLATALCLFVTPVFADMPTEFPIHPKEPIPKITKSKGIGTSAANLDARIGKEEVRAWCENWKPGDTACAAEALNAYGSDVYKASANCQTGELTNEHGNHYQQSGLITGTDMFDGRFRFKDLKAGKFVGVSNAAGGLVLASQWLALCPYGLPYNDFPLKKVLAPSDDSQAGGQYAGHNGSSMKIDTDKGFIVYLEPKHKSIEPRTLLFRGSIVRDGPVSGMAFTFKKGCEPAPYYVDGYWDENSGEIVLRGPSPVRSKTGCEVTGYTSKSPNATLKFELLE
ncbi:hypothetical protein [Ochrobactrum quorumnocens]|uniref:hypothetical protein n=1 Tax=Ochrobactrum quorumnocens TaxID=271865 RepID=UPI003B9FF75C